MRVVAAVVVSLLCMFVGAARADALDTRVTTGYRNGRPVKVQLVEIDWALVEIHTARAFLAMREAAARDGVELVIWSGFRSNERQAELYQRYKNGYGNRAAKPGYSNHQLGKALDLMINQREIHAWLTANAKRFGFHATVKGEPWHWEFKGKPRGKPAQKSYARRKR